MKKFDFAPASHRRLASSMARGFAFLVLGCTLLWCAGAKGQSSGCCGDSPLDRRVDLQERLHDFTRSAMGFEPQAIADAPVDGATLRRTLADFGRGAANFAIEQSAADPAAAVKLFGDMVSSRTQSALPRGMKNQILSAPLNIHPRIGLTREDYLAESSFVDSAVALIKEISAGKVPFVIDGTLDSDGQFLDCVAIGDEHDFFCTGTLIQANLVVTAHHCDPASIRRIFIGLKVPGPFTPPQDIQGHVYAVKNARVPPAEAGSQGPPNDIIVLELAKNVDPSHAKPRAVASVDTAKQAKWSWIAGFGNSKFDAATGASGFGSRRKRAVPLIPGTLASSAVASAFGCHFGFEFATGNMEGAASCFGDSGGPIYVRNAQGEWQVAGCVSRALPSEIIGNELCGLGAVNTLVPKYPDLIKPSDDNEDAPTADVVHRLQVSTHASVSLSDQRADEILATGSKLLQTKDGSGDVACSVALVREGAVGSFSTGDGTIDSAAEFQQIINLPGAIKVVREINWCGGPGASIIGCAPVPGKSLLVVRFTPDQEGVLWTHEFGHNKGLSHRNQANAVMRPFIGVTHREVNSAECNAYRQALSAVQGVFVSPLAGEAADADTPVREFVRRVYIHGIPWDQASQYNTPEDLATLLSLLFDAESESYRDNVVTTLALTGSDLAVGPLLNYAQSGQGKLSDNEYRAKRAAIMGIGILANRTGNERALEFLVKAAKTPEQVVGQLNWKLPYSDNAEQLGERVSTMAVWGLALSGKEPAIAALDGMSQNEPKHFGANGNALLREALEAAKQVQQKGVLRYHGERGQ